MRGLIEGGKETPEDDITSLVDVESIWSWLLLIGNVATKRGPGKWSSRTRMWSSSWFLAYKEYKWVLMAMIVGLTLKRKITSEQPNQLIRTKILILVEEL